MAESEGQPEPRGGESSGPGGRGTACECAACRIRVLVCAGTAPPICPFCQATLREASYALPPPGPPLPDEPERSGIRPASRRFSRGLTLAISTLSVVLLAVAVYVKLFNVEYFWYQPWINAYSLTVGVFILSRFFLAAFYHAPQDVGYEPTVAAVVACRNEEDSIERTIGRIYAEGYPRGKLEAIAVNDGSTDSTLDRMLAAQARHPELVIVDFLDNKGKRHGMAVGALLAQSEILLYVDSDSFLMPGSIRKVVQGLADPTVAAVAGHTDVENARANLLTKMQDVRYFVSYRVMKAAESLFGAVSCCPGCFSAYRKVCVLNVLDRWLHQRFLGRYATFGDDRSLTNHLLRRYRVLYDDEALATTIVPENWMKYSKQQARWKRSWLREMLCAGRFFWRKHPVAAISWYAMVVLPLLGPVVMFSALVVGPLVYGMPAAFYVGGVLVVSLLWSLYYLERTRRAHWWAGFVFTITYMAFYSWQGYYALFTLRKTSWGTR